MLIIQHDFLPSIIQTRDDAKSNFARKHPRDFAFNLKTAVTNTILSGFEMTTIDKCAFCDSKNFFFSHLFNSCVKVASFWCNVFR